MGDETCVSFHLSHPDYNSSLVSACHITGGGDFKSPEQFKLSLPQRTNYLYGRITKTLPEMYAFTLCMWIKSSAIPGIGTPFSYGVPGQANEIVLIEWGNNPIELLINDKASHQTVICFFIKNDKLKNDINAKSTMSFCRWPGYPWRYVTVDGTTSASPGLHGMASGRLFKMERS